MCGIAGIYCAGGLGPDDALLVRTFRDVLAHRGPDDAGEWSDGACALGHRRLAIIDLSRDGRQPFASADGRHHIVFNGEIFNYLELRRELEAEGAVFRTKTDTEVLLAAWLRRGPDCLSSLNGMFAFAVYDSLEKTLFLARDRFGVKPLYYARAGKKLYFASEIKALLAIPGPRPAPDGQSLFEFLVFNRTDIHEETFFSGIRRLPKGCAARADADGLRIFSWWDPMDHLDRRLDATPDEARREVEELFLSSVALRLRSDVRTGACLSGGLDSSILMGALFDRLGAKPGFPAFTAAYPGKALDESAYVDALNRRHPFHSLRVYPDAAAALENLEDFVRANDEPVPNSSFYSQYEVMRLAGQSGVKVLLDGQGGDEIFAGYHYFHGFYQLGLFRQGKMRALGREMASTAARRQDKSAWRTLAFGLAPPVLRARLLRGTVPWLARDFFHDRLGRSRIFTEFFEARDLNHSLALHFRYKLEHLLRCEDRNSMAFSIEARTPYLDYRLVELLLALPGCFKVRGGQTRVLQKEALGRYSLPEILARRDKIGFATPQEEWMREPAWASMAEECFARVREAFPGVFSRKARLPADAATRWKIIQLDVWRNLYQ